MKFNSRKLNQLILIGIILIALGWLLNLHFAPFGKLKFKYDFSKPSPAIDRLLPEGRVGEIQCQDKKCYQEIIGDPVYFNVKLPRPFEKLRVAVEFKNPSQEIFEVGAQSGADGWQYKTAPLENKLLDWTLWPQVREGELILFQKDNKYTSIGDFLSDLPDEGVAVYNYDLDNEYKMPGYQTFIKEATVIKASLAGTHRWYTYIKDEILEFEADILDTDKEHDDDDVMISVYTKNNKLVKQQEVKDEGNEGGHIKVEIPDLEEGAYKIEISSTDDIFIYNLTTAQQYIAFIGKVSLGPDPYSSAKELYTESENINFSISRMDSAQTVNVGKEEFKIEDIGQQYEYKNYDGMKKIEIEKPGMTVAGDGLFSFSEDEYFDPNNVMKIKAGMDIEAKGIKYILARYKTPKDLGGGWSRAEAVLPVIGYDNEKGIQKLMFSVPGIEEGENSILVRKIEITAEKKPWSLESIRSKFK